MLFRLNSPRTMAFLRPSALPLLIVVTVAVAHCQNANAHPMQNGGRMTHQLLMPLRNPTGGWHAEKGGANFAYAPQRRDEFFRITRGSASSSLSAFPSRQQQQQQFAFQQHEAALNSHRFARAIDDDGTAANAAEFAFAKRGVGSGTFATRGAVAMPWSDDNDGVGQQPFAVELIEWRRPSSSSAAGSSEFAKRGNKLFA